MTNVSTRLAPTWLEFSVLHVKAKTDSRDCGPNKLQVTNPNQPVVLCNIRRIPTSSMVYSNNSGKLVIIIIRIIVVQKGANLIMIWPIMASEILFEEST